MKPTLDTRVQGALETAENLENATSGAASRLAYSLRQQLDEIVDEVGRITYEYGVEYKYLTNRGAEWRLDPGVGWHKTYRDAERAASASVQYRIVRRRVSPPEVIDE